MSTKKATGSQPRRRAPSPRVDRRQALIDAAIELISENSDADISASVIAQRAGVAHGLLFYYFTDRKGLIGAALTDILTKLAAHQSPLPEEESPRARVAGFVRRHIEFIDAYRTAYTRVVREGVLGDPEVARAVQQARADGARQVARLAGLDEPLTPLVRAGVSGWIGFLDRCADDYFDDPAIELDQLVDMAVDTLLAVIDSTRKPGQATGSEK